MNPEVTNFINELDSPWKITLVNELRELVHSTVPDSEERIQYKKPHFLKDGHYAAVISPSKDAITFMIMNTENIEFPKEFAGPEERRWIKISEGQKVDFDLLSKLLAEAVNSL